MVEPQQLGGSSCTGQGTNTEQKEAVATPSLEMLDRALSSLGWWKVSLPMAGGWNWVISKVLSKPNHSKVLGFCF